MRKANVSYKVIEADDGCNNISYYLHHFCNISENPYMRYLLLVQFLDNQIYLHSCVEYITS